MLLDKKNIIVVGGTSGIGKSAVKAFINEGARLTVIGRDSKKLSDIQTDLGNYGIAIEGDSSSFICEVVKLSLMAPIVSTS